MAINDDPEKDDSVVSEQKVDRCYSCDDATRRPVLQGEGVWKTLGVAAVQWRERNLESRECLESLENLQIELLRLGPTSPNDAPRPLNY